MPTTDFVFSFTKQFVCKRRTKVKFLVPSECKCVFRKIGFFLFRESTIVCLKISGLFCPCFNLGRRQIFPSFNDENILARRVCCSAGVLKYPSSLAPQVQSPDCVQAGVSKALDRNARGGDDESGDSLCNVPFVLDLCRQLFLRRGLWTGSRRVPRGFLGRLEIQVDGGGGGRRRFRVRYSGDPSRRISEAPKITIFPK